MKKRLFDIFIILTLVVASFIVYSNTFDASFHYDDFDNIVDNEKIRMEEFGWQSLIRAGNPEDTSRRPVAYVSFALNYYFGRLDVSGYHLVNTIIHILTGIGVYFLIKITLTLPSIPSRQGRGGISRIPSPLAGFIPGWVEGQACPEQSRRGEGALRNPSFIAALAVLLWLLSPIQTQAVTYIVQRMASMAALFYVWSFFCYIKGRTFNGEKRLACFALSMLLFLLALGTKQNTITLPFMILLYEVAFFRKGSFNIFKEKRFYISVLAGISILVAYLSLFIELFDLLLFFRMGYGARERLFTEGRVVMEHYLPTLFFPIPSRLALIHDFPLSRGPLSPFTTLPSILFIAGAMALSFYKLRSAPLISFFALWFFINILPEAMYTGIDIIYDHRLYLPSIGFYAVLACSAGRTLKRERRNALVAITVMVTLFFSVNTYNRNRVWHDEVSLWSDNIKKAPMLSVSHEGLGIAYLKEGKLEKAEDELKTAKALNPLNPFAVAGLGTISYMRGDVEGAFREFEYLASRRRLGVAFYTGIDKAFYNLGNDLLQNDRLPDAERMFRLGLEISPENKMLKSAINELERRLPR